MSTSATATTSIVGRIIRLATCLLREGRPLGISEMSRLLQLPKATVHRLVTALAAEGAVVRYGNLYDISDRTWRLLDAAATPTHALLRTVLAPHVMELFHHTRHSASLAVLRGTMVFHLEHLQTRTSRPQLANHAPAHATAMGKALLAHHHDIHQVLGTTPLPAFTTRTITDPADLTVELASIRTRGVAYDHGEHAEDQVGMATTIDSAPGGPVAAIGVAGPRASFSFASVEPVLRRVAHTASTALRRAMAGVPGDGVPPDARRGSPVPPHR
ncbi:IclR family transcriptional regulator [Longispora fulva]|uniref:DNA-binding IclR family transcriptional regulator n=1 Tax=Longispora fulva TaxID=619741 RepID=A0A8J7GA94_9ACTN|nr:IclR family transcriptional regulator C-terminal domain-containing protein [Longispora fulva]MBG6134634.1 DNA-binding IclR family transcriptional regulator [Longispora fulva]